MFRSIATSAGYMTAPLISSLAAYMMVTGEKVPMSYVMVWMIALGVLAFRGASPNSMYTHTKRALRMGATKEEVLEAFEVAAIPGGPPVLTRGLRALMQISEEATAEGKEF